MTSELMDRQTLLRELLAGLDAGRGMAEATPLLVSLANQLARRIERRNLRYSTDPPPRKIALALAQAVFSQPHIAMTFRRDDEPGPMQVPLVFAPEALEGALGVARWELDDLRDEVDRRAGVLLKQGRTLHWMWHRFGLPEASPEALFRVLLPGAPARLGPVNLVRKGNQLYCLVDEGPSTSLDSLFFPWLDPEGAFATVTTFQGRYVDRGLKRSLMRSLGADEEEIGSLLDGMVTIIPKGRAGEFLKRDHWRSSSSAALTWMGHPYGSCRWVGRKLSPQDVDHGAFLTIEGGRLETRSRRRAFDQLAVPRLRAVIRQAYAQVVSRLEGEAVVRTSDGHPSFVPEDLVAIDIGLHLDRATKPLFDWARSPETAVWVAQKTGVPEPEALVALAQMAELWAEHYRTWWRDPTSPSSVTSLATAHLVSTIASLRRVWHMPPDVRHPHQMLLGLFAGHYLAEAPVERLWEASLAAHPVIPGNAPPPEDVVGEYFWPAMVRLLDALDGSDNTGADITQELSFE